MVLHLGVDKPRYVPLMKAENLSYRVGWKVAAKMRDHLLCKIVKQVSMLVVGNIVEID
jgi:hypothetical protein